MATQSTPAPGKTADDVMAHLSAEDRLALQRASATYRRAAAVSATAGDGLLISTVTTAGTVTLTMAGGGTLTVNVPVGSSFLALSVTAAAVGTAVGATFQSLFFT